jgi:hypothetical protein
MASPKSVSRQFQSSGIGSRFLHWLTKQSGNARFVSHIAIPGNGLWCLITRT